jgi:uncharacterized protein YbjT (DUF2867 family)
MHLLVLGASGGCGRWAVRLATERGHRVTAVVRLATPYEAPAGVEVIRADVTAAGVLDGALGSGAEGVVCCLGVKRVNPRNPWSAVPAPHDLAGRVAADLAGAMPRHRVRRVVAISSAGVGSSAGRTHPVLRWVFAHSNVQIGFADLEAMERTFERSGVDWVAVRPTRLVDGPPTGRVARAERFGLWSRISRGDVAAWMLDAVEGAGPVADRTPMITAG